ncbi:NAD(P)-binding domain-containing protein [Enterococcus sp. LJL99]
MKKIAIIGGHGQVGQIIVQQLIKQGKNNLVIMGRNKEKMASFTDSLPISAETRVIDLTKPIDPALLSDLQMVIVCLDQENTLFIEQCQQLGIDYLDITANSTFLKKVYRLPAPTQSRTLVGIGLAPGITNLAVANYLKKVSQTTMIDIDILLGMGDQHGKAAVEWTFSQLNQTYRHPRWKNPIATFTQKKKDEFGTKFGHKSTYNFDFADQHLLALADPSRTYTTFLGFDINWITNSLAVMKKIGLTSLLKNKQVLEFLTRFMQKGMVGSEKFVVKISNGSSDDQNRVIIYGDEEATMTGEVTAFLADKLLSQPVKSGFYLIDELTTLEEVVGAIPRIQEE